MRLQSTTWFVSLVVAILVLITGSGCAGEQDGQRSTPVLATQEPQPSATATAVSTISPPTSTVQPPPATATAVPSPTVEAPLTFPTFYYRDVVACGQDLPIVSAYDGPIVDSLSPDAAALETVLETLPEAARPALDQLLAAPQTVGLAAYRVGEADSGVYLNAGVPVPLASVVKVNHLVAYAEAVAAGELNPTETVMLEELDRFYFRLDQRAHRYALEGLEEDGRIFGQPPALILDEVAHMMIEYSSNAATDYLHMRLGQKTIEATAQELGLESQTAPCPFVGQFLIMDNHTRPQIDSQTALEFYTSDPQRYGRTDAADGRF
jgi:beta-lactamase class A